MPRNMRLEMFQPTDAPFSSTLPPDTVKRCQNLRRAWGPSTTVNSQSSDSTSLSAEPEGFNSPLLVSNGPSTPPGRMVMVTLAKVPSGMISPLRSGSASFRSYMVVSPVGC